MADPIKTITLKDGTKRYRFVVDIGRDPITGKRQQKTYTFDKKGKATKELNRIRHQTSEGTYVKPSKETVSDYIDSYLKGATRGKEESTKSNYAAAFRCVRERIGHLPLQRISKGDVEDLVDFMLTKGRKRGGKVGTPLSARSVQLTLGRLTAALEMAVLEGKLVRNVAKLVETPKNDQEEREPWSKDEVHAFLGVVQQHRLHAAWRLSLYGLRRAEVLGLRWEDIDLKAKTLAVVQTRVLVDYRVIVKKPKSKNSVRTLPLDDELVAALTALRKLQSKESEDAGDAYRSELDGLGWYDGGEYVVIDELGTPFHPEWYSDEFGRILRPAGVRRITLHDSRHTTLTLMEHAGVPISVISRWAGHYDPSFTYKKYVHANDDDLAQGAETLAQVYKIKKAV
ncbi:MAG: Site-specific recombinase XerD [Actinomycetia bacterium]|nr:Site-specific recombinase XerD [Actinomycetes bacterium]